MLKKVATMVLAVVMAASLFGCSSTPAAEPAESAAPAASEAPAAPEAPAASEAPVESEAPAQPAAKTFEPMKAEDIKAGFIYIGPVADGGYTLAHDNGRAGMVENLGIETVYIENVPENADCEKAIRDLIDQGCNVIVTTSFGHMQYTYDMAEEYPDIKFMHCSGYMTADNMSTYFGRMIEPRYLSGIVAGKKTASNKIGYVAAMPVSEVIRGINAFTLGVRSVNPDATVEVIWTNSWYDPSLEKSAALELLSKGCDVIAQHCDTTGPQIAAQEKGAFAVGYNSPTYDTAPQAYLTAPLFHWDTLYTHEFQAIIDGTWSGVKYWGGMSDEIVSLDTLSENCAEGTQELVDAAKAKIIAGEPFFVGPLNNNEGEEVVPAGTVMTDDEIWNMNWFVEGVIGTIPQ